jgi:hypothetical protein
VVDNAIGTGVGISVAEFNCHTDSLEVRSRKITPSPHLVSELTRQP